MPSREHFVQVARVLRQRLDGQPFLTIERKEITDLLRQISGDDKTRIRQAGALKDALLEKGIRCCPELAMTSTTDRLRLFPADGILGDLVDLLLYPGEESDEQLRDVIATGEWRWTPSGSSNQPPSKDDDELAHGSASPVASSLPPPEPPKEPPKAPRPNKNRLRSGPVGARGWGSWVSEA